MQAAWAVTAEVGSMAAQAAEAEVLAGAGVATDGLEEAKVAIGAVGILMATMDQQRSSIQAAMIITAIIIIHRMTFSIRLVGRNVALPQAPTSGHTTPRLKCN